MQSIRHQVFLSSTFRDLVDERQVVLDAILELGHFPAGMETFPAANATPWQLIERVIADSDYYVLIVGGRYGTLDENGISYTEKEFDLAKKLNKPILAFLHKKPENLPFKNSEQDSEQRKLLETFRKKVEQIHCKYWSSKDELKCQVILGLTWAIRTNPVEGWVRSSGIDNSELLKRLADLQARHDQLLEENALLKDTIQTSTPSSEFASGSDTVELEFTFLGEKKSEESVTLTWEQVFYGVAEEFLTLCNERSLTDELRKLVFGAFNGSSRFQELGATSKVAAGNCNPSKSSIRKVIHQFLALGLIEHETVNRTVADIYKPITHMIAENCWRLTKKGASLYLRKVAAKRSSAANAADQSNGEPT